jgi:hypothetical protein
MTKQYHITITATIAVLFDSCNKRETGFNASTNVYNCFYNFPARKIDIYRNLFIQSDSNSVLIICKLK